MRKFLAAVLLAVCAVAAPAPKPPKLVLAVVIDQFRYDYLLRFRKDYNSGLARLLEHGAVFTDAHHIHFPTVTAVGHSTFLSGATPSSSGIVANEWFDRESGQSVTSVSDPDTKLIGGAPGTTGSSPHRMLVSTVGDELKMAGRNAKVIGISIKDRSAILPVGHTADAAYWYDGDSNNWVTSSFFMADLPDWVKDVNRQRPFLKYQAASWFPLGTGDAAKDASATPFCTMAKGVANVRSCGWIEATPWGNEMLEEFAERALVEEKLGQHDDTDILAVSFSSNDYVGHAVGPDAPEVHDISIRTDRLLGRLFDFIDQRVGAGNTLVVLTADHGVAPVPEVNQARKMPGGRLSRVVMLRAVTDALTAKYGEGKWIANASEGGLYLNRQLIRDKKLDPAEVEETVAAALRGVPHIFRVYTRSQLAHGEVTGDYVSQAVLRGFYEQRSGDVTVVQDPYYLFGASGTSHSTPFNYDSHVPVIFMGEGIRAGEYHEKIAVNDIAPTLATILRVEEPSGSIGRILSEIFQ
jgi:predicted AlkP superfamily pyrophosphatase or phosphodiesterase